ncbi:hypothetical protein [Fervidicoccus fontis]|uniref:Transcription regulator TrmB N-terminal domain-containing protein n=1 Tax=Fervidicoccus fontis TaxID=683846 RepID=A0A7C2ZW16_9CREN|nr:hypothetical protein [Fervidicoccus fontis]PMB77204.1 MAG: hypothetical protein C0177_03990 [Fervidicoccus fontis]HEW63599.1 hypothetical protein [Fervidicoccus fontis]
MILDSSIEEKLRTLKRLDGVIDFSKSSVQIEIVFLFLIYGRDLTPTEISESANERRKAVLDALRKLQLKGIVKKVGEKDREPLYGLSEEGKKYSEELLRALGLEGFKLASRVSEEESIRERLIVQKKIIEANYIYNAICYLATSKDQTLSLKTISRLLNLSEERAKEYLDIYSRPPERLFRKIIKPDTRETYYKLEKEGLSIFYRTQNYLSFKNSPIYKLKQKLYAKIPHPNNLKRLFSISSFLFFLLSFLLSILNLCSLFFSALMFVLGSVVFVIKEVIF